MYKTILSFLILLTFSYSDSYYKEYDYPFFFKDEKLEAKLIIPKNKNTDTVIVFLHGDGAMPYDAYGYYNYLWEVFAFAGISSYSWSKKGVDSSQGNWLLQSMEDRAYEAINAINKLKEHKDYKFKNIGIISFSQAGWVTPILSQIDEVQDFSIFLSPAINWMKQKEFYEKHNKASKKKVSKNREIFISKNYKSDSTKQLKYLKKPVLLLLGEDDKNVDIKNTKKVFEKEIKSDLEIKVFEEANHGLLKTKHFKNVKSDYAYLLKLWFLEEKAYIDNLDLVLLNWLDKISKKTP